MTAPPALRLTVDEGPDTADAQVVLDGLRAFHGTFEHQAAA